MANGSYGHIGVRILRRQGETIVLRQVQSDDPAVWTLTNNGVHDEIRLVDPNRNLDQAFFCVLTDFEGIWDFGSIQWSNITLRTDDTSTKWCTSLHLGMFSMFDDKVSKLDPESTTTYLEFRTVCRECQYCCERNDCCSS